MLLQERIYTAWRGRRVLSLISFDVKGAYNGVCKERLLQRMKARGIPVDLLRWLEAFCSERTAIIQINGQVSKVQSLPQAGLPQGSPLSPILFLFFNADLVQRQIDSQGGAMAFVDDFTAWVTGPTVQTNPEGIEAIINAALDWEERAERLLKQTKQPSYTSLPRLTNWTRDLSLSRDKPLRPRIMSRSWASSWTRNSSTRNILRGQHPRAWKPRWSFEDFGVYPQRQRGSYLHRRWRRSWTTRPMSGCTRARIRPWGRSTASKG